MTYFAVRRETHGISGFGTTRSFRNVRYLIAIGAAKRTLTNDVMSEQFGCEDVTLVAASPLHPRLTPLLTPRL